MSPEDVVELIPPPSAQGTWDGEYGIAVGGIESKGAGSLMLVSGDSIGKVFAFEASTAWATVHFPLSGEANTPHWVECVIPETQLKHRPDLRDPFGPG